MAIVKILEKQEANRFPSKCKKPKGDDDGGGISRTNVEEALQAYRDTLTQILKERDVKWDKKTCWNRPDIEAAMRLRRQRKRFFMMKKRIGRTPGIRVGDEFQNRAALTVVGLHCQFRKGIDYMKSSNGKIYATSIVNSARYDNDSVQSPDTLIYSGEGGNPGVTNSEKRFEDQKLERGNLALKNSMEAKSHVRVIRCFKCLKGSASSTAYFYDGLYKVTGFWRKRSKFGKLVYVFLLRRDPDQQKFAIPCRKASNKLKKRPATTILCKNDISEGKEKTPIRAVNKVDNDESPPCFSYICDTIYPDFLKSTATTQTSCDCEDGCSDSKLCPCAMKNEGVLPYDDKGRRTNRSSSIVYECGAGCKCSSSCKNRVSQRSECSAFKLEVFKTKSKAWGVRSLAWIPRDSFICEYVGEVVVLEDNNGFRDACEQNQKQQPLCFPLMLLSSSSEGEKSSRLAIDATKRGNVGRFVNHSPSPNLYVQRVLIDHEEARMPHMMLFAKKDIRPYQELTFDFNCNVVAN